jgi:pimeloyl-ACP methyl ester carboxylesterase
VHTALLVVLLVITVATLAPAAPLPPPRRETFACTLDGSLWPYLVQDSPGPAQGLLINLHGHYADETQMMTEGTYEDAFGKLRRECLRRNWVYVCTWYGGNSWMGPVAEAGMVDLIGVLKQHWPGVPVYLQGGSMGGSSALVFATRQPQLLRGVIARCPAGDIEAYYDWALARAEANPTLRNITYAIRIHYTTDGHDLRQELQARSALRNAERLTMPVSLCHGAADALIPADWTRALAEKLRALGRKVQYEEIPGGDHDSPVRGVDWGPALDFISA